MPPTAAVDPVFQRTKFLLRQKHFAINEKYYVGDEQGNSILFVERPAMLIKSCLAILAALVAFFVCMGGTGLAADAISGKEAMGPGVAIGALLGIVAAAVVASILAPKRHVYFYRD